MKEEPESKTKFNTPSIDDIKIKISVVHKMQMAPKGAVYFIGECKWGKVTYSRAILVKRSGMPVEVEDAVKNKFKATFLQQLIIEVNKPLPLQKRK